MTALSTLARMLGVSPRLAEDALHSERAAKAVLSRRSLFAAGAAMAGGSAFSFPEPRRDAIRVWLNGQPLPLTRIEVTTFPPLCESMVGLWTEVDPRVEMTAIDRAVWHRSSTLLIEYDDKVYESTGRIMQTEATQDFVRRREIARFHGMEFVRVA